MKFKLDENLPVEVKQDLQDLGHDADSVVDEKLCGAPDPEVLEAAFQADRILLTLDKGIANLQRYPTHHHSGVVLFRPDTVGRSSVLSFIRDRLRELLNHDLPGRLTVVGPLRIRTR